MINTINDRHLPELEGIYTSQASDIETVLTPVRSPLMVCIDATNRAKVVLGCHGIELVK